MTYRRQVKIAGLAAVATAVALLTVSVWTWMHSAPAAKSYSVALVMPSDWAIGIEPRYVIVDAMYHHSYRKEWGSEFKIGFVAIIKVYPELR